MPRPMLKPELQPHRKEIIDRLAKGDTARGIVEWLDTIDVKCETEDLDHFKAEDQQAKIRAIRERLTKSLPINDDNWCLLKLNEIAEHPGASPNEVLSAIRTSRQIVKGEGDAGPMDWQKKQ